VRVGRNNRATAYVQDRSELRADPIRPTRRRIAIRYQTLRAVATREREARA
jgi:hypothetical protein